MAQDLAGEHPEGVVLDHRVAGEQRVAERRRDREGEKRQSAEDRERDPVAAGQSCGAHLWLSRRPAASDSPATPGGDLAGGLASSRWNRIPVAPAGRPPSAAAGPTSAGAESVGSWRVDGSKRSPDRDCAPRGDRPQGLRQHAAPRTAPGAWPAGVARLRVFWRWTDSQFARWRHPKPPVEPYIPGVTRLGWSLVRPALMGFVATTAIFLGATQPNSPFTSKLAGSWFFGIPAPALVPGYNPAPGQWLFFGVVAVYGGMLLLLRAWYDIVKLTSGHPGIPVARLAPVFAAWVLPLLVVAPLFSRDVYDYAAQGEMMTHGINPYLYGTSVLGATPFSHLVDPLWGNVSSPYGPLFLVHRRLGCRLRGSRPSAVRRRSTPARARRGRALRRGGAVDRAVVRPGPRDGVRLSPPSNPLVLLHLVVGSAQRRADARLPRRRVRVARRGRPVAGIVLCGFAAAVKIPALIGAVYIGWEWLGQGRSIRERVRPGGAMAAPRPRDDGLHLRGGRARVGLDRWPHEPRHRPILARPRRDRPRPRSSRHRAFGHHIHVILTVVRGSAACLAGLIGLWLLVHSERIGSLQALGWTLLAVVVLGPVVQLAVPVVELRLPRSGRREGLARKVLIVSCSVDPPVFSASPGGHVFVNEIRSPRTACPRRLRLRCVSSMLGLLFFLRPKYPPAAISAPKKGAGLRPPR